MTDTQLMILEFGSKGYTCAQIIMLCTHRILGIENPDLIRAMAGLGQGVGCSGEVCGALSGGVCMLALYTAKGSDTENTSEAYLPLSATLVEWFRERVNAGGSLTCDAILGSDSDAACRLMDTSICGSLVHDVWEKVIALLQAEGIDPTQLPEQV